MSCVYCDPKSRMTMVSRSMAGGGLEAGIISRGRARTGPKGGAGSARPDAIVLGPRMRSLLRNLLLLAAAATACRHRPQVAPRPLFPMAPAWTTPLSAAVEGPVVTDGTSVYVATRDGTVRRLDGTTGLMRWEAEDRAGVLAASEGRLVVRGPQGTVWAIDAVGGAERWKVESGVPGVLPPVIYKDAVIVAGQGLAVLDVASGRTRWSLPED